MPILYTVLTTICAFLSLIFSGIKPIIDFGWMMALGLLVSILLTFILIPSLLNIISSDESLIIENKQKSLVTSLLGKISKQSGILIFGPTLL